ncbi:hypothetical protein DSO57_1022223 [Entomophthora muscae]|uniref:Uncharacterized protein n=1 Tax=Entomophthora muscae TaxID=34485 RepID=A0ACC2SSE7_9FUNG|nr:hypothetical protein DSO57_1022223 [Entomophthora muscae]
MHVDYIDTPASPPLHFMVFARVLAYRPWVSSREIPYTALAVMWFLLCTYIVCLANSYMDVNNPSVNRNDRSFSRLPDALIDWVYPTYKTWNLPENLPDTLVQISTALMFLRIVLGGRKAATLMRRAMYVSGVVYLIRAPFIVMTALPNPLESCQSTPNPNHFYDALLLMAQLRYSCGDVFYSGHTILFMVCCLIWYDFALFNSRADTLVKATAVLWGLFCHFILITSSYHYTVDVVIAICIVLFFWKSFCYLATTSTFDSTNISRLVLFLDQERYTCSADTPMSHV